MLDLDLISNDVIKEMRDRAKVVAVQADEALAGRPGHAADSLSHAGAPQLVLWLPRHAVSNRTKVRLFLPLYNSRHGPPPTISSALALWGQTNLEFPPLGPRASSSAMSSCLAVESLWSRAVNRAER